MKINSICLSRKLTTQLLHLAQSSPEFEICGLVGDANGIPCSFYPIENVSEIPNQQYLMNEAQQIAAMKKIREKGENLFAIYHSHPNSPAIPSALDLQQAVYPQALHLIISLNTKGVLEMRAFKISEKSAEELDLTLSELQT